VMSTMAAMMATTTTATRVGLLRSPLMGIASSRYGATLSRRPASSVHLQLQQHRRQAFTSSASRREDAAAAPIPKSDKPDDAPAYSPDHAAQPPSHDPNLKTAYLYFSIFPIRVAWWDIRSYVASFDRVPIKERIAQALPPTSVVGHDFHLVDVQERLKDGGAFGVFRYRLNEDITDGGESEDRDTALLDIERHLQKSIKHINAP